jgi:hypothetical protein
MVHNSLIDATKYKNMNVTNLGIWYQQIPSMVVVNPLGKIVEIREYHGSKFVLRDRKRFAVSKLTRLNYHQAMEFKEIFWK